MEITINEKPSIFDLKALLARMGYTCSSPLFNDNVLVVKKGTVAVRIKPQNGGYNVKGMVNSANILVALPAGIGAASAGIIGALIGVCIGYVIAYVFADKDMFADEIMDALKEHYTVNG